jgi:hypothetical protein
MYIVMGQGMVMGFIGGDMLGVMGEFFLFGLLFVFFVP